jgi:hypothetical protein
MVMIYFRFNEMINKKKTFDVSSQAQPSLVCVLEKRYGKISIVGQGRMPFPALVWLFFHCDASRRRFKKNLHLISFKNIIKYIPR